jgi:hypothetical protein
MPFNATIACAILNTLLGCLYLGSTTAFGALVGSVATLTTTSYTAAILPNLLTGRKNIRFGPFHMKGWLGFVLNGVACTYMIVFFIIFCFPYHLPTNAKSMNYSSPIFGGMTIFVTAWYFLGDRKGYKGPRQSEARSTKHTWTKRFRKLLRKHRKPRSHIDIPSRPLNCLTTTPARFQLANSSAYHIRISDELILPFTRVAGPQRSFPHAGISFPSADCHSSTTAYAPVLISARIFLLSQTHLLPSRMPLNHASFVSSADILAG